MCPGAMKAPKRPAGPVRLKLAEKIVKLTILQRGSKPIPGSDGRVFVGLGDITAGQVLLSVTTDAGDVLLDDTSLRPGDAVEFHVGKKPFTLTVRALNNFLVGDDFGVVEISAGSPEKDPGEKPKDSKKPGGR